MSRVIVTDRESLLARRQEILEELGMSLPEFRAFAVTRSLSGAQWDARDELDGIAFLLGEDD